MKVVISAWSMSRGYYVKKKIFELVVAENWVELWR
jgi:hypothetical protein